MVLSKISIEPTTAIVIAVACVMTGCSQSKVAQCKQLVNIARTANETAREAATGKPEAMRRAAESFDRAASDLNKLSLADAQIKEHRSRLADIYADTSRSTREFLNAIQQKDRNLAEIAVQSLEQSANNERNLIQDINQTCQVAESAASKP
ncbi:MAG TPA: hypothetical protein V6D46_07500 [Coleofasciculaceae cyanobacterium]